MHADVLIAVEEIAAPKKESKKIQLHNENEYYFHLCKEENEYEHFNCRGA